MGGGVIGNRTGTMHEIITGNLYTPGHGGVMIKAGIVIGILEASPVAARWCASVFSGTDVSFHNESIPLVGAQFLRRQVDLDSFRTAEAPKTSLLNFAGRIRLRLLGRLLSRE